jgi:hypothetical protein
VAAFRLFRFPGPPSEPDVRVSTHPALHVTVPLIYGRILRCPWRGDGCVGTISFTWLIAALLE